MIDAIHQFTAVIAFLPVLVGIVVGSTIVTIFIRSYLITKAHEPHTWRKR